MIHFEEKEITWKMGITLHDIVLMERADDPAILICLNEFVIHKCD